MAKHKHVATTIPPHTVRHVDGVMHLTLEVNTSAAPETAALRFQPPTEPTEEA